MLDAVFTINGMLHFANALASWVSVTCHQFSGANIVLCQERTRNSWLSAKQVVNCELYTLLLPVECLHSESDFSMAETRIFYTAVFVMKVNFLSDTSWNRLIAFFCMASSRDLLVLLSLGCIMVVDAQTLFAHYQIECRCWSGINSHSGVVASSAVVGKLWLVSASLFIYSCGLDALRLAARKALQMAFIIVHVRNQGSRIHVLNPRSFVKRIVVSTKIRKEWLSGL